MNRNLYIVTYDLVNPGRNYESLLREIKQVHTPWAMLGGSSYLIISNETAVQIRDRLNRWLDVNDKVYVGSMNHEAAWSGLGAEVVNWIMENQ